MESPETLSERDTDQGLLTRVKLALTVTIVCLTVAAGRWGAWPFVSWPMYRGAQPEPVAALDRMVLRAEARSGYVREFGCRELLPTGVDATVTKLVRFALDPEPSLLRRQSRRALVAIVARSLSDEDLVAVDIYTHTWDVDRESRVPPDPDRPDRRRRELRMNPAELLGAATP